MSVKSFTLWFYLQTISGNHTWRERAWAHSSHCPKLISKLTSTKLRPTQIVSPHCPKPIFKLTFKPFSKKKKRTEPRARRESRADEIAHTTPDRTTTPNPRLHRSRRTPAPTRSHPSTLQDRATWSTSEIALMTHTCLISLFLDLPIPFLQLLITLSSSSLRLTEFLSLMNVLFWFLFLLSLYIEIFYYEICLEAKKLVEKIWETSRKITFLECNQTLENIF